MYIIYVATSNNFSTARHCQCTTLSLHWKSDTVINWCYPRWMSRLCQFTSVGWSARSEWHQCLAGRASLACMWCWTLPGSGQSSPAAQTTRRSSASWVCWQRGTARICPPLLQQSIDIFCLLGPQQQTCSRGFAAVGPCWDRQMDAVPFHRPCSTYYAGSANNNTVI